MFASDRGLLHELENLRHGRTAADDVFEAKRRRQLLPQVLVLDAERALAQRTLNRDRELVDGKVLR